MPHFSKHITTPVGNRTFYFNRIYTVNGVKYHVSAQDGISYYFMMKERNGSWIIDVDKDGIPDWIMEVEKELERAIYEHLGKG
jgi:hypothetical protein